MKTSHAPDLAGYDLMCHCTCHDEGTKAEKDCACCIKCDHCSQNIVRMFYDKHVVTRGDMY